MKINATMVRIRRMDVQMIPVTIPEVTGLPFKPPDSVVVPGEVVLLVKVIFLRYILVSKNYRYNDS